MLTGKIGAISYRELLYWAAYNKLEREQYEQERLGQQAKANLPHYRRKA